MELDAVQRPGAMPHAHDFAFVGPGADDEIGIVERLAADNEAVIARRLERIGQAAKNTLVIVMNGRSLAVHDAFVAHHFAAENVADALMSQANAEDRHVGGEAAQHLVGDAGLARRTGPGEMMMCDGFSSATCSTVI